MAATQLYNVLSQVQVSQFNQATQQLEEGFKVTVRWASTGNVFSVFVPASIYTPQTVDAMVSQAGDLNEQVQNLGALSGSTS